MKLNIQSVNFSIQESLRDFINKRVSKFEKRYDKIIGIDVFLKAHNKSDKENKSVELILRIPGNDIIVKKEGKSFEEAIDKATEVSLRSLNKVKDKEKDSHN